MKKRLRCSKQSMIKQLGKEGSSWTLAQIAGPTAWASPQGAAFWRDTATCSATAGCEKPSVLGLLQQLAVLSWHSPYQLESWADTHLWNQGCSLSVFGTKLKIVCLPTSHIYVRKAGLEISAKSPLVTLLSKVALYPWMSPHSTVHLMRRTSTFFQEQLENMNKREDDIQKEWEGQSLTSSDTQSLGGRCWKHTTVTFGVDAEELK